MPLDPSIALGYRPPVIQPLEIQSPLDKFQKVLTLRGLMEQSQLRGLQTQQAQQKLEEGRQAAENEAAFRNLYADPNAAPTRSQVYGTLGTKGAAVVKTQAEIEEQDLKTRKEQAAFLGSVAGTITDAPTLNSGVMRAVSAKALDPEEGRQILAEGWTPQVQTKIKQFGQLALNRVQQLEQELKNKQEERAAADAAIKRPGLEAEAEQKRRAVEVQTLAPAMAGGAVAFQRELANLKPERRALYLALGAKTPRDLLLFANTPHEQIMAQQATETAAETARQHGIQNATAQAQLNLSRTRNTREQNIYEQTYGAGANPALVGVDPKLRTQVTREAQKIGTEYLKANELADQMQSLVDLTRTGNKAAGSNLPLIGVETLNAIAGIKRINRDEINQYKGAGSLYDKIVGKLQGAAIGQPIPADVLKDIEALHNTLRQNADSSYKTKLEGLNSNYKSAFQPVRGAAAKSAGKSGPPVGTVVDGHKFKGGDPHKQENWEEVKR